MLYRLLFILLGCLMNVSVAAQTTPRTGKDYALFFAVHQYKSDKLTNLPNTINNANEIAKVLRDQYGFKTEVIPDPSMADIEQKLSSYRDRFKNGRLPKDGQLLVFFSGHGVKEYNNGYFLPADTDPDRVLSTAMSYNTWRPFISQIGCQHILVAIDACYSVTFDPDWRSMTGESRFERIGELNEAERVLQNHRNYKARIFFTSDAKEDIVPGRSNFARKLLEGLSNHQPQTGFLTASELFANYVKKAQPAPRANDFEQDDPRSSFLFFPTYEAPKIDANRYHQQQRDINAYTAIQNIPTIENCQQYLLDFPNGNFRQKVSQLLLQLQEEQDWKIASLIDNKIAYQNYLKKHPKGLHAHEARQRTNAPIATTPTVKPPDNMVFVQGGTFEMGDVFGDGDSDEKPVHSVTLNSYYMGRYEVTVAEFSQFIASTNYKTDADKDGGSYFWKNDKWEKVAGTNWQYDAAGKKRSSSEYNHPVIHVSWNDAIAYCNWRSERERLRPVYTIKRSTVTANWSANGYRLPTEAEWEYAARSRGKKEKWAGTSEEDRLASYGNYGESGGKDKDGHEYTSAVGFFRANDLGLYDMSGNVWEWCWDWYEEKYSSKAQTAPTGPSSGFYRVLRGGSWFNIPAYLRCANRVYRAPGSRYSNRGFRLSRAAP